MLKEPEAPRRPEEDNDTRPVSGKGDDRLLLWCLVASLFINFGFGLWLNYANLNGTQPPTPPEPLTHRPIQIYKKPPPKPKIIPPKPKVPPKVVKIVHIQPRPTPPPPQHFTVGSKSTAKSAVVVEKSAPPEQEQKAAPVAPENSTPDKGTPTPPPVTPAPEAKVVPPTPAPAPTPAPVHHDPPKPSNWQPVDSRAADVTGIDAPDPGSVSDPTQITGPCVVSFEVSETGHISSVRVKKSSGSSEFDQLCVQAVQKAHGVYAIQDHIPYAQRSEQTFSQ